MKKFNYKVYKLFVLANFYSEFEATKDLEKDFEMSTEINYYCDNNEFNGKIDYKLHMDYENITDYQWSALPYVTINNLQYGGSLKVLEDLLNKFRLELNLKIKDYFNQIKVKPGKLVALTIQPKFSFNNGIKSNIVDIIKPIVNDWH